MDFQLLFISSYIYFRKLYEFCTGLNLVAVGKPTVDGCRGLVHRKCFAAGGYYAVPETAFYWYLHD